MKRLCLVLIGLMLFIGIFIPVSVTAEENDINKDDIVIIYTNDTHTYIDNDLTDETKLSFSDVSALKKDMLNITDNVLLVDAGDHIQGTPYGSIDNGKTIIELMNMADYDIATVGNHEFDYGLDNFFNIVEQANFPYVSCNIVNIERNENILDSYKIFEFKDKKVAVIGISTPETIKTGTPKRFQNINGEFVYDVLGGIDGCDLYSSVQSVVDEVRNIGVDYVAALGHLGVNEDALQPWSSRTLIANTNGIDAFIDGHSHSVIEEIVTNKDGKDVVLTQTGSGFNNVGELIIRSDGTITTKLISTYDKKDEDITRVKNELIEEVDKSLSEKVADNEVDFTIAYNDERFIRNIEGSIGDFIADGYYYVANKLGIDCDVALLGGGSIRADFLKGDLTYKSFKQVQPFGNALCAIKVSGQQLLDALEWGARMSMGVGGSDETGAFLQVAGMTYSIDKTATSSVQSDPNGMWIGSPVEEYRVNNVMIYNKKTSKYEKLKLDQFYTVCGLDYNLCNYGDGFTMFDGGEVISSFIVEDYMSTVYYAQDFIDSDNDNYPEINTINSPIQQDNYLLNYDDIYGSNRITFIQGSTNTNNTVIYVVIVIVLIVICLFLYLNKKRKINK